MSDMPPDERIPCVGSYRSVPLHDRQSPERLALVRKELDIVFDEVSDPNDLFEICKDAARAPEARLLAAALIKAGWEQAADDRRTRPKGFTLADVDAAVAGLDSVLWRSPKYFCSDLDNESRAAKRTPADNAAAQRS